MATATQLVSFIEIFLVLDINKFIKVSLSLLSCGVRHRDTRFQTPLLAQSIGPSAAVELAETCARIHPDPPPVVRVTWPSLVGRGRVLLHGGNLVNVIPNPLIFCVTRFQWKTACCRSVCPL
jgi:hypothetical protein